MFYHNPIHIAEHEQDGFGDPFVYRYLGNYYLFVSSHSGEADIRCYQSTDLIHWSFAAYAAKDPLLEDAYAPEVIRAYNRFYLVTSPGGNGHYFFIADKITGPYTRLSENVGSMIDGSLSVDKDGRLFLLRADHGGIAILNVSEEGELSNRRNIPVRLGAWTEGPGLFYRDGLYYLTCCGNNVLSKGYRVAYAYSEHPTRAYQYGLNNPLLINTGEGPTRLGHSSTVLAPDLDGYYLAYHTLEKEGKNYLPRSLMMDRARFSGSLLSVNRSIGETEGPKSPQIELRNFKNDPLFIKEGTALYLKDIDDEHFTAEIALQGKHPVLFLKKNDGSIEKVSFEKGKMILEGAGQPLDISEGFDFDHLHTIRFVKGEISEIYIDNAIIYRGNFFQGHRFGLDNGNEAITYFAYNPFSYGESDLTLPTPLPGLLDVSHSLNQEKTRLDPDDLIAYRPLWKDTYRIESAHPSLHLSLYARLKDEVTLKVNDQEFVLKANPSEYDWLTYDLGDVDVSSQTLTLKCVSGALDYKCLIFDEKAALKTIDIFKKENEEFLPQKDRDSYYLDTQQSLHFDRTIAFTLEQDNPYGLFGLLFDVHDYSNKVGQARYPFEGFLIGFEGNLLILDRVDYQRFRLYDQPTTVKVGETHRLRAKMDQGHFEVYLDGVKRFETTTNALLHLGSEGLYCSDNVAVRIRYEKERR